MRTTKQAWAFSIATAMCKERGKRGLQERQFLHDYPVAIDVVDPSEAPVMFQATFGGHDFPYRVHEGRLFRPLVGPDKLPIAAGVDYLSRRRKFLEEPANGVRRSSWVDNPFGKHMQLRRGMMLWDPEHCPPHSAMAGVQSDDRSEVAAIGAQVARDVIEIDGVLHRAAEEPMWRVIDRLPWNGATDVELVMPELLGLGDENISHAAVFRYDQKDVALAYADRVDALYIRYFEQRQIPRHEVIRRVSPDRVVDISSDWKAKADVETLSVRNIGNAVIYATEARSISKVSTAYLAGHLAVRQIVETAERGSVKMSSAVYAFDALRAGIPIEDQSIPRVESGYWQAETGQCWLDAMQALRPHFEGELEPDEEAIGIALR